MLGDLPAYVQLVGMNGTAMPCCLLYLLSERSSRPCRARTQAGKTGVKDSCWQKSLRWMHNWSNQGLLPFIITDGVSKPTSNGWRSLLTRLT